MIRYNQLLRAPQRSLGRLRPTPWRRNIQRRLESTEAPKEAPKEPVNRFVRDREAVQAHAAKTAELWRKLIVIPPSLILGGLNAWILWKEHWEHWETLPPLEERVQYPWMNIRNKPFPWGDGDKTLL
ncbi:MAG: Cytochrome c oxidase subunit 6A, mitochondrial [Lichina confinis]|nr:MAG: Cytochrome c oxidase subunit 6A, mitochondrial [Lichina confinis]